VRLLLKNLGKRMPETEIREKLEALHVQVQAVMQLRSRRRDQDAEKERRITPHFIVSVALGPDVAKVRSHRTLRSTDQSGDVQCPERTSAMSALRAQAA
jgi:hypothetical protein